MENGIKIQNIDRNHETNFLSRVQYIYCHLWQDTCVCVLSVFCCSGLQWKLSSNTSTCFQQLSLRKLACPTVRRNGPCILLVHKFDDVMRFTWYSAIICRHPETFLWHNSYMYRKTSNIRRTLVGNKIVDHSDVVGASPVGAAPTTSSFST